MCFGNEYVRASCILLLLGIVLMRGIFHPGFILDSPSSDMKIVFLGKAQLFIDAVRQGTLPFWDPYILSGYPFYADPEFTMTLYPPNFLLAIAGSVETLNYLFLLHLVLAGICMYAFLRYRKIEIIASLFGSVSYMLSGFVVASVYAGHYTQLVSLAYVPLFFLLVDKLVDTAGPKYAALLAVALALNFYGAHMQFFVWTGIMLCLYAGYRLWGLEEKSGLLKLFAAAGVLFTGMALVQVVPYAEFRSNVVAYDYAFSSELSFTPVEMLKGFVPFLFGAPEHYLFVTYYWESSLYVGAVALVFLLLLLTQRPWKRDTVFFVALMAGSIVLSFGKYLPFFEIIWNKIFILNMFRSPVRLIFIATFCMSVLAAFGLHSYRGGGMVPRILRASMLLVALMAAAGFLFRSQLVQILGYFYRNVFSETGFVTARTFDELLTGRFYPALNEFFLGAAVALLALAALYVAAKHPPEKMKQYALVLLVVEAGFIASLLVRTENLAAIVPSDELTEGLPAGMHRVFNYRVYGAENHEFYDYRSYRDGVFKVDGDSTLVLQYYDAYLRQSVSGLAANNTAPMQSLSVRYIISPVRLANANLTLLKEREGSILYELSDPSARAAFSQGTGKAVFEGTRQNEMYADVDAPEDGELIVRETFYPGWKAYCNGAELPVSRENVFMKVKVPEGSGCMLRMVFEPNNFRVLLALALLSLCASLGIVYVYRKG
ncbi:MAG: YfhO family protein [Candidatus Aenigmarchaeota archaeon]|nr:YfhO family protein [Candidatus Aenigmarchaeota archaeon]